jgi:hypothetical protein
MICKVCSAETNPFAKALVLKKYNVEYFRCDNCGTIQTEYPFWIEDAYSKAITISDVGLVQRNINLSKVTRTIITLLFNPKMKFIDYGGGYGLFVRIMRDHGLNFFRIDKYCENLFAKGFDADLENNDGYELVTAFEVFEHLLEPLDTIKELLEISNNILFSTLLIPDDNPKPEEWWYYGLEHGQHMILYTKKALTIIANRFNLNLYSKGNELHLLTKKKIPNVLFKLAANNHLGKWFDLFPVRYSHLENDFKDVNGIINKTKEKEN